MVMEKLNGSWVRGSYIGGGANGTVNLALNLSNGEVFAVKSVEKISSKSSQLQALDNEINILKSLNSPYIVRYLGDDETSSFKNLHMEYMPGGTAADSADSDEGTVRSYTWCLVSALSYLHSRGISHCDVKGKNVLLGPTLCSAKLADFGSAAVISAERISPRGSPLWMAPEVLRGEYQGPESDVWSLGCTVIEMLTGKPPAWDSVSLLGYSPELPKFPSELSNLGCDFLRKCLRRDAKERWSCDQLLQHPFISQCSLPEDSSPRCVLDLFELNFEDEEIDGLGEEEDDEDDEDEDEDDENLNLNLKAEGRIRGLISGTGVNWESDGWVEVRLRGTSSEYFESMGANLEMDAKIQYDVVAAGSDDCELVNNSYFIVSLNLHKKNVYDYCSDLVLSPPYTLLFFVRHFVYNKNNN